MRGGRGERHEQVEARHPSPRGTSGEEPGEGPPRTQCEPCRRASPLPHAVDGGEAGRGGRRPSPRTIRRAMESSTAPRGFWGRPRVFERAGAPALATNPNRTASPSPVFYPPAPNPVPCPTGKESIAFGYQPA